MYRVCVVVVCTDLYFVPEPRCPTYCADHSKRRLCILYKQKRDTIPIHGYFLTESTQVILDPLIVSNERA